MATITRYVNPASADGGDGTTNATSGANRAYASLNDWEGHEQQDLNTGNNIALVYCEGTEDSTQCTINGWTTSAADYIQIQSSAGHRHSGKWDDTKYHLVVNDRVFVNYEEYIRFDGLQINGVTSGVGLIYSGASNTGELRLSNSILKGGAYIFESGDADVVHKVWNCIGYGMESVFVNNANPIVVYNCTAIGCTVVGFRKQGTGTYTAINCLAKGNTYDFYADSGSFVASYCASSDTSADNWGGTGNHINHLFTFKDEGSYDYHLASDDVGAIDLGVSDPGSGLFSDDIDGVARGATWDIGADEYVAAAGLSISVSETFSLAEALD